ncbi:S-adenosyl-L-methionine-dependent methyltransferase [Parachaetomium inaequale]|uniref:S-adenosyl-L-methionine-dependent methyltransferase n=1 Tax=Parachaetomium inaequale TaxID=2588326 RepID=A0AAN6SVK7_9PEZI|nr:S-adenosyl-L-methionine-dependent methyltransferase [Parachaetomium inaequale]
MQNPTPTQDPNSPTQDTAPTQDAAQAQDAAQTQDAPSQSRDSNSPTREAASPTATQEPTAPAQDPTLTRDPSLSNSPVPARVPAVDPTPTLQTVTQPGTTSDEPPPDLKQRIKESYDAIAVAYNQWALMHRSDRFDYVCRLIRLLQDDRSTNGAEEPDPDLPSTQDNIQIISLRGMQALEVGCGSGVPVLEVLLAKDMDTIGVDLSSTQIALAKAHFPNQMAALQAVWAEKDMMELRYPPDMFHVVVALYSLNHLPREEQTVFLARVHRWLKVGGMVMINFPQEEREGDVEEHWLGHPQGWMFWSSWGEEKMMQVIEGLEGMEVLVKEVKGGDGGDEDPKYVWVIARKNYETGEGPGEGGEGPSS